MSNSYDKKEAEDILEILMEYYPSAKRTIDLMLGIQKWAKKLSYPINSFSDLAKQLQKNPITIDDKETDFANVRGIMPAHYFPIASFENLIEKAHEIMKLGQKEFYIRTRHPIRGIDQSSIPVPSSLPSPKFMDAPAMTRLQIPPPEMFPSLPVPRSQRFPPLKFK